MVDQSTAIGQQRRREWSWAFWPAVPLYPYGQRRTLRTEVVPDTIWTFDQVQGIFYVVVPIRMTVVKLEAGGLLVYAPVAPTPECIQLMNELVAVHGDVKYIILPTVSGIEHKVFVGPFARQFPTATVFVAPGQWSFPLNLPLSWLGLPGRRTKLLPSDSSTAPFAAEFDYELLGPIGLGLGSFAEAAFFHRRSRTLLVTDTVLSIPAEPPAVVQLDPYPLLFHAKDGPRDAIVDTPTNRTIGWQRVALFSFYFRPSVLDVVDFWPSIRDIPQAVDRSRRAYFGWFPFRWQPDWRRSFEALRRNGRLIVAPILRTLILNRASRETLAWANRVAQWEFQRIIPCHLDSPLDATPEQFLQAFAFLDPVESQDPSAEVALIDADLTLLQEIDQVLRQRGITPPPSGL